MSARRFYAGQLVNVDGTLAEVVSPATRTVDGGYQAGDALIRVRYRDERTTLNGYAVEVRVGSVRPACRYCLESIDSNEFGEVDAGEHRPCIPAGASR